MKLNHILFIVIGVLLIILYFVWSSKPEGNEENKKIKEAEEKIDSLEILLKQQDSVVIKLTKQRDSVLTAVRGKVTDDEKDIEVKYVKVKENILNLSNDSSIELLRHNLGANE